MVVTNSGNDVPKAIIVKDINRSLKPIYSAIADALSTTRSLPKIIPASPITISISDTNNLWGGFSLGFWSFLCLIKAIK